MKLLILTILLIFTAKVSATASCSVLGAACDQSSCLNNVCGACSDATKTVESSCQCASTEFWNYDQAACQPCDRNCGTCRDEAIKCTSCTATNPEGWGLDLQNNQCACNTREYLSTTDPETPCQRCFIYGKDCVSKCPSGTTTNEDIWRCEAEKPEDVANNDKLLIIIVAICIIVLQILLTICLFNYLYNRLKKMFDKDSNKIYPLTEEEQLYLAQQAELERQRNFGNDEEQGNKLEEDEEQKRRMKQLEEEEAARQAQLEEEEKIRAMEEAARLQAIAEDEKRREEEEAERRRRLEEEERRRRQQDEERMRLEEERRRQYEMDQEAKRKALEEQIALEAAQAEERKRQEEERLRLEAERRRREEEEKERRRREEEERARLDAEEAERRRLRQLAEEERRRRKMERQMTRQSTMAANDEKLRRMREERERLRREKEEMEGSNRRLNQEADDIDRQYADIEERRKRNLLRKQQTMSMRQSILGRQATIAEKRKELEAALEGVNYEAAKQAVQNMNQDDLVFLQNLKNPPERIKLTLDAVVIALNNTTKTLSWDDVKKEITNINFRRNVFTYDPDMMKNKIMEKLSKEYISNPNWVLPKIHKAAKAAGILAEWIDSLIKFKIMMAKNKPLFDQVKEIEKEEREMEGDIEKLAELEDEEKQAESEIGGLDGEEKNLRNKQEKLRKQATLNHPDIEDREVKINKLNTGDVSLEAIEESDDEEEDPEADEILKGI